MDYQKQTKKYVNLNNLIMKVHAVPISRINIFKILQMPKNISDSTKAQIPLYGTDVRILQI
jgi:hypothetical protein